MTDAQVAAILRYWRASDDDLPAATAELIESGIVSEMFGRWPDAEPVQAKLPLAAE